MILHYTIHHRSHIYRAPFRHCSGSCGPVVMVCALHPSSTNDRHLRQYTSPPLGFAKLALYRPVAFDIHRKLRLRFSTNSVFVFSSPVAWRCLGNIIPITPQGHSNAPVTTMKLSKSPICWQKCPIFSNPNSRWALWPPQWGYYRQKCPTLRTVPSQATNWIYCSRQNQATLLPKAGLILSPEESEKELPCQS